MIKEAELRPADVKNASTEKSRGPLKFKVDGGLRKMADLYERMDGDPGALDACWEDPGSVMDGFVSKGDIRLSAGYKKLADAMGTLDLAGFIEGFNPEGLHKLATSEDPAITKLRHAICGTEIDLDDMMQAGVSDGFNEYSTIVVVVMMITVTVTTGSSITPTEKAPTPSLMRGMQMQQLVAHAQTVADQLGWYSRH